MTTEHRYKEHLEVTSTVTLNGSVEAGATVRSGAVLDLRGAFAGPLIVEAGGVISVMGSFVGAIRENRGVVMLHGQIDTNFDESAGRVVVGVESVITSGDAVTVLRADGTLEPINGDVAAGSLNVRTDVVCFYDASEGVFVPLGPLKP